MFEAVATAVATAGPAPGKYSLAWPLGQMAAARDEVHRARAHIEAARPAECIEVAARPTGQREGPAASSQGGRRAEASSATAGRCCGGPHKRGRRVARECGECGVLRALHGRDWDAGLGHFIARRARSPKALALRVTPWDRRATLISRPLCSGSRGTTLGVVGEVDMPIDSREGRRTLHVVAAADSVFDGFELDEADQLAIAVVASAAGGKADESAEVALQDGVGEVGRKLGEEEARRRRVLQRHFYARRQ